MRNFEKMTDAQYKEYMTHYNKAFNAFDKVMECAQEMDALKLKYNRDKYAIESDASITETHREKKVRELYKGAAQAVTAVYTVAANVLPSLADELNAIAERIDLNDSRLSTAVSLMSAAGPGSVSASAQGALVEPFAANLDALNMLLPIAVSANMSAAEERINKHIAEINKANQFIDRAFAAMRSGSFTPEADYVQHEIMPFASAVAQMYNFTAPTIPEDVQEAAVRAAMGLAVK